MLSAIFFVKMYLLSPKRGLKGRRCFIAGTLVLTEEGYKKIEDIQVGDMVLAYDEETGEQCYKPVKQLFRNESKDWTSVTVSGGEEIISTPGHKYYLPETKSWVAAENLKIGTKVLLSDGSYGIVEAVKPIHYDKVNFISIKKARKSVRTPGFSFCEFYRKYFKISSSYFF